METQICIEKQTIDTGFVKHLFVGLLSYKNYVSLKKICFDLVFAEHFHLYDDYEGDLIP